MIENIKSTFVVYNEKNKNIKVYLIVDYENNDFSICNYNYDDSFTFKENSKDTDMWLCVVECIKQAILFGNAELNKNKVTDNEKKSLSNKAIKSLCND